jgi:RNA-splicing ligase RtcB
MIHTGSRGFGYQVCDDSIREMMKASEKYGIYLPDRQLCAAPFGSPEVGNISPPWERSDYAFANRQMITHWIGRLWKTFCTQVTTFLACHSFMSMPQYCKAGETSCWQ